jgi:hypothetical protein
VGVELITMSKTSDGHLINRMDAHLHIYHELYM